MGLELKSCHAEIKGTTYTGKLHVDATSFEFRSAELNWTVPVGKGTHANAIDGKLSVRRGSKSASFAIGDAAEKWVSKILNPPTLGKKLGLKPGLKYLILGGNDDVLTREVNNIPLNKTSRLEASNIVFVFLNATSDLKRFQKALDGVAAGTHIWAIWPKGVESIRQRDVIGIAKENGIGPGKGISFDVARSAMRFTKK